MILYSSVFEQPHLITLLNLSRKIIICLPTLQQLMDRPPTKLVNFLNIISFTIKTGSVFGHMSMLSSREVGLNVEIRL